MEVRNEGGGGTAAIWWKWEVAGVRGKRDFPPVEKLDIRSFMVFIVN